MMRTRKTISKFFILGVFISFLFDQGSIFAEKKGKVFSSKKSSANKSHSSKPPPLEIPSALLESEYDQKQRELEKEGEKTLSLFVGIYHDEPISFMPRKFQFSGNYKKIMQVHYHKKKKVLRIYPKKPGLGILFVKDLKTGKMVHQFHISVAQTDLTKIGREIKELLKDIDGIFIRIINNKVVVDGQIFLPKDMNRIYSVIKQYDRKFVHSLVTLSSLAQVKIAKHIEREINNPAVQVRSINGKFVLEGVVKTKQERDRAEIITKTYVPDVVVEEAVADKRVLERKVSVVVNLIDIVETPEKKPAKKMIQIVVHYVELKKDYSRAFRFQWTPDIADGSQVNFSTGSSAIGGALTTITGTVRNLFPKLNWAKEHGHARVLRSSSFIVEDGKEGELVSIEKIPYRVISENNAIGTKFEDTGLNAKITPNIINERSNSISVNVFFSIKALTGQTESGPLISEHKIQTTVVVRSRSSAAIGGLISNDSGENYNKLPANSASKNPIISLLNSKDFRRNQSQFVVFITPRIQHSASEGAEKIKRKFRLN